jgi:hypothetical protein
MTYGEMIATIQCYIHHTKDIEIDIALPANIGQIKKMQKMYAIASDYFS